MADNVGKPGSDTGYRGSDPRADPRSDPPSDSGRQSTRSYDRSALSRPPPRRDPRADPDDEPSSSRVDVVSVDRNSSGGDRNSTIDSLTNAALTLRRELAKLHQQAAAVERTIEDQRRERSDALERADHISSKNLELEQRVHNAELEVTNLRRLHEEALSDLQRVRAERDDLARAVESAKLTADDLSKTRDELGALRRQQEEVVRAAGTLEHELAEIRKREQASAQKSTDVETELQGTREKYERTNAELASARDEIASAKNDLVKAKAEALDAAEAAAHKLAESEHERLAVKEQVDRLDKQLAEMRIVQEKVVRLDAELTSTRGDLLNARAEAGRLERDLEDVRRARDVQTERATMAEQAVEGHKKDLESLRQQLESATATASGANQRAATAERAKLAVDDAVRTLRDEITTAFARWRSVSPSIPPPAHGSVAPPTRAVPLQDFIPQAPAVPREEDIEKPREPALAREAQPVTAPPSAMVGAKPVPTPAAASVPPSPNELEWDDKPAAEKKPSVSPAKPPSERPSASMRASERPSSSMRASERPSASMRASQIPPPSASMRASKPPSVSKLPSVTPPSQRMKSAPPAASPAIEPKAPSIPPLHPRSVPPQPPQPLRTSVAPLAPASLQGPRSVPPPLPLRTSVSVPPAVYPSVPPLAPSPSGSVTPTQPPPPMVRTEESSVVTYVSQEREQLIEQLASPKTSREAAVSLREHPDWLRGRPPIELLLALTHLDYDIEEPVFELARAWDRDPLCRALIAALRDEPEPKLREHGAWLLKHLGSASSWLALAELVSNEDESPPVRRWLLEAIERLVATRLLSWAEVGDLCQRLVRHPNPSLRDGAIGVVAALDRSDDKRRLLLDVLRTDHDEVVLASAVQALTTALPIELDPSVAERLLGHPSARVQQSVVEFIERSKRAAKSS